MIKEQLENLTLLEIISMIAGLVVIITFIRKM